MVKEEIGFDNNQKDKILYTVCICVYVTVVLSLQIIHTYIYTNIHRLLYVYVAESAYIAFIDDEH